MTDKELTAEDHTYLEEMERVAYQFANAGVRAEGRTLVLMCLAGVRLIGTGDFDLDTSPQTLGEGIVSVQGDLLGYPGNPVKLTFFNDIDHYAFNATLDGTDISIVTEIEPTTSMPEVKGKIGEVYSQLEQRISN